MLTNDRSAVMNTSIRKVPFSVNKSQVNILGYIYLIYCDYIVFIKFIFY